MVKPGDDSEQHVHDASVDDQELMEEIPLDDDQAALGVEGLTRQRKTRDAGEIEASSDVDPDFRQKLRDRLTKEDDAKN